MSSNRSLRPVGYVVRKFPVLSETFVLGELLGLEARGVPLHIFSLQRPNDPRFHDDLPKLKARVSYVPDVFSMRKLLGHNRRLARSVGQPYLNALLFAASRGKPSLLWRLLQSGYIANEARRLGLRHLHAQFANRPASAAYLASRMTGIPFSFTAHATDIFKAGVDRKALARKIEEARFVITVSDYNKAYLDRITPDSNGKIVRIYNGIDLNRFSVNGSKPQEPFRIVTVARLVEKKGLSTLVDACRRLRDHGVDFRCDIIGKGRLRPQLRRQIKAANLQKHVRLVGPKTQREVVRHYHTSHLYVLPSIVGADGNREGLPVSIVEALACGLPVITTPVTGIPEAVRHGHNGLLVPPADPETLCAAIETVIRDPDLYQELRANARPSVTEKFDREESAALLHRLLEDVA